MTDDVVMEMRDAAAAFVQGQAAKHGVDDAAVRSALAQKTWRHVGDSPEQVVSDFDDQESAVLRILMDTLFLLPPQSRCRVATAFSQIAPDLVGEADPPKTPSPKAPGKADPEK